MLSNFQESMCKCSYPYNSKESQAAVLFLGVIFCYQCGKSFHVEKSQLISYWQSQLFTISLTYNVNFICNLITSWFSSVQSLSHVQLFVTPWTAAREASLIHHQLPEFTQTHVYWVGDAIQPSHPLSSPSPPAFNLSQHQGLFQWVSSSHQVFKVLELQLQHPSFQWIFRTNFL